MSSHERSGAAVGLSAFAAVILLVVGVFQVFAVLAALAKHNTTIYPRPPPTRATSCT